MESSHTQIKGETTMSQQYLPSKEEIKDQTLPYTVESPNPQIQLISDHDMNTINHQLVTAGEVIEATRQRFYETKFIAHTALQNLQKERNLRQYHSNAHNDLQIQYRAKAEEVLAILQKCVALHHELEQTECNAANEKLELEKKVQDLQGKETNAANQIQNAKRWIKDLQLSKGKLEKDINAAQAEHQTEISLMQAREVLAEARVIELEEEKAKVLLDHQSTMLAVSERAENAEQDLKRLGESRPAGPETVQRKRRGKQKRVEELPYERCTRLRKYKVKK